MLIAVTGTLRVTIAAILAHILKGYYPRKIPLSNEMRDEMKDCFQVLADPEDVVIGVTTIICAKTMCQLRWHAQTYLNLYRSTSLEQPPVLQRPGPISQRQRSGILIKPRLK